MSEAEDLINLLKNSRLFKNFSTGVLEAMIPMLLPCDFDEGALVCLKGDPSDCLYIVRQGEVEVSVSSGEGKIIVLGTLSRGDVFGEVGMLDKGERTASVTAKTNVSLYRLNSEDFDKLVKLFGIEELKALTSYICFLFRRATNNLEETAFMDGDVRIARKIRELYESSKEKGNRFEITMSQEDLGRRVGLSREATNKALSRLESGKLIERKYRSIIIPDVKKFLKALS